MTKLTAFAAAALMAAAGVASAGDTVPMNPNKSTQAPPPVLAGLVGTQVAAGTIVAAVVVGTAVVLTIVADDGSVSTTTTTTP